MSLKIGAVDFNTSAKVITVLFGFYLVIVVFTVSYFGPFFAVTTPIHPVAGSLGILASAVVGFKAVRMFGGRRNFTGRLIMYYSIALLGQAFSWVVWGLFAGGQIPTGTTLIVLGFSSIIGQILSAYTLLISARAVTIKLDRRRLASILVSLLLSGGYSIIVGTYLTSPVDRFVWSGVWSVSIFVQLGSALILVSYLGKWYLARPIANIAFAYIGYSIATSLTTIIQIILQFPLADYWIVISVISAASFYTVGLQMSQVRPMSLALSTVAKTPGG